MARHNLCTNPSATNDVTGWTGGATPVRQTGLTGFSRTTGARYSSGTFMQVAAGAASPGLDYTVSVDIRPNTNGIGSGTFYVAFTRSTGGDDFSHTVALGSIAANTVVRKAFTATAPANTTGVYLIIDGVNFGAVGSVDFTAVLYEQASSAGTFFDGDTPGASWDGTAGNSASTLADAGANPTGLAVALTPGTPTVALNRAAAPAGLAVSAAAGTPAAAIPSSAPGGIGLAVALGTPSVALNRVAAPTGIAAPATPGSPGAALPLAAPGGVALAAAAGQPGTAYTGSAAPAGIAVAAVPGTPRVGAGRPVVSRPNTGTVVRPNTGTVVRPNTGTVTRPNTGTVTRPDIGRVVRP